MDIGMQVTLSETFNIVGADLISQGVPLLGCSELPWIVKEAQANPVDSYDIFEKLKQIDRSPQTNVSNNQVALTDYVGRTKRIWLEYFRGV